MKLINFTQSFCNIITRWEVFFKYLLILLLYILSTNCSCMRSRPRVYDLSLFEYVATRFFNLRLSFLALINFCFHFLLSLFISHIKLLLSAPCFILHFFGIFKKCQIKLMPVLSLIVLSLRVLIWRLKERRGICERGIRWDCGEAYQSQFRRHPSVWRLTVQGDGACEKGGRRSPNEERAHGLSRWDYSMRVLLQALLDILLYLRVKHAHQVLFAYIVVRFSFRHWWY